MTHTRACETAAVVPPHPISLDILKKQDSSSLSSVHTLMEFLGLKEMNLTTKCGHPLFSHSTITKLYIKQNCCSCPAPSNKFRYIEKTGFLFCYFTVLSHVQTLMELLDLGLKSPRLRSLGLKVHG